MKALVLTSKEDGVVFNEHYAQPVAQAGEVRIKVLAAALNHRDVWITQGQYAGIKYPTILGSDGVGIIESVGEGVSSEFIGQTVIINPNNQWGDSQRYQSKQYHIMGLPKDGTLAEFVVVDADKIRLAPAHLTIEQAAALPLAGLTAYRALFGRAQLQAGEKVLISGIGGGVALFAMQFAIAAGAEVYVTSSSEEKIAKAVQLGAKAGVLYNQENWQKAFVKTYGEMDIVIDSACGNGFAALIDVLAFGGRIAFYGGGQGAINGLNPQKIFWKQVSILGSTMGSDQQFVEMVDFVEKHHIKPVIDGIYALEDGQAAFKHMAQGAQFGKIVVRVA
jgi:zinc-binding alcohol dehydrogenase/oxidoreductase